MPNIFHFPIILLVASASSKVGAAAFSYGTDMKNSRVGEEFVLLFSLDAGPFECKYLDYSEGKHVNRVKGAVIVHFSVTQSILLELEMVWYPHCSLPTGTSSMEMINKALEMVPPCFDGAMTKILLVYSTIYNTLMENGPALLLSVLMLLITASDQCPQIIHAVMSCPLDLLRKICGCCVEDHNFDAGSNFAQGALDSGYIQLAYLSFCASMVAILSTCGTRLLSCRNMWALSCILGDYGVQHWIIFFYTALRFCTSCFPSVVVLALRDFQYYSSMVTRSLRKRKTYIHLTVLTTVLHNALAAISLTICTHRCDP